jgi:hypothetical protein
MKADNKVDREKYSEVVECLKSLGELPKFRIGGGSVQFKELYLGDYSREIRDISTQFLLASLPIVF